MHVLNKNILSQIITARPAESHKGSYGRVLTVGGNTQFGGAIIMATSAIIHSGAGLSTCATSLDNLTALHTIVPEAMFIPFDSEYKLIDAISSADIILVGPGLGVDENAIRILQTILQHAIPQQQLIIDGSAITIIADHHEFFPLLKKLHPIFTPHQMEWQRLSGLKISEQDDIKNTLYQQQLQATVVLKKNHTTIYHRDGSISQLAIGGPYMATGGMGDTLAGIIAGFLAQFKLKNYEYVVDAAVYAHSAIADEISKEKYVVLPTDIIADIQVFMKRWVAPHNK
ncbi:MAG: NAD(P)H-hydrate dehydratase [Liquorilactobacillus hordei]|uniref:ADP-dependent (S)-NAD(P)H-hydrate dehydratase n=1 Tax=Liquorilactobacillus hordei DSM 19519 TaxID=1423759 RepID=A0A0R1MRB4_9LACO|nr:NAD(P)H-hydrate dehydratase [Liquorilactobacillus hordei]KRL07043.1 sugar kinase [Liquorilactobacillus hordei DSM 19519]MBZ2404565.1 NAD(P)H-hydrate dehydratase [Liquorilactobacillus hordei]QYH52771.1 NAD(P)H-hydrate dehydratase [Liquorilactobacillus hordei DSM 19519]